MDKKQQTKAFGSEEANDIANDVAGHLINTVYSAGGRVPEIMATLNMMQALVVKNCLNMVGDSMNMQRADTMIDLAAEKTKETIRALTTRVTN